MRCISLCPRLWWCLANEGDRKRSPKNPGANFTSRINILRIHK